MKGDSFVVGDETFLSYRRDRHGSDLTQRSFTRSKYPHGIRTLVGPRVSTSVRVGFLPPFPPVLFSSFVSPSPTGVVGSERTSSPRSSPYECERVCSLVDLHVGSSFSTRVGYED